MKLASIGRGDLVLISKGGRHFHAQVTDVRKGAVHFEPLQRGISYRHASAREVIDHWRHARRRAAAGEAAQSAEDAAPPPAVPKGQLSLAGRQVV